MRFLSLFSGIEAASAAWKPLGWECAGVAEIEPFPCAALSHHYPDVPNLGDVTKIDAGRIDALGRIDVVIFGSPCQDLSLAGKRKGLDGERSGLFFEAMRIIDLVRPRFALWENVPGAFSSNAGLDFAAVVERMAGVDGLAVPPKGWGTEGVAVGEKAMVEWAVLDAQWFGVAQRRRRVFALADFGDWSGRPPVLLEPEGVRGDSPPSREAREDVAGSIAASTGGADENDAEQRRLVLTPAECGGGAPAQIEVGTTLTAHPSRIDFESETLIAFDTQQITSAANRTRVEPGLPVSTLAARGNQCVAYRTNSAGQVNDQGDRAAALTTFTDATSQFIAFLHMNKGRPDGRQSAPTEMVTVKDHVPTLTCDGLQGSAVAFSTKLHNTAGLDCSSPPPALLSATQVRRLTPIECERLQGFPDNYTQVPNRGKPAADGPRYKALGNSMAVPVIRWIGEQIEGAMLW